MCDSLPFHGSSDVSTFPMADIPPVPYLDDLTILFAIPHFIYLPFSCFHGLLPPISRSGFAQLQNRLERRSMFRSDADARASRGTLANEMGAECFASVLELLPVGYVAGVLREAIDRGELAKSNRSLDLAAFLLNNYEGALLRSNADRSSKPLETFCIPLSTCC